MAALQGLEQDVGLKFPETAHIPADVLEREVDVAEEIGSGGYGRVWQVPCWHTPLAPTAPSHGGGVPTGCAGSPVAVKLSKFKGHCAEALLKREVNATLALNALGLRRVVKVHSSTDMPKEGAAKATYGLVLEYCANGSLQNLVWRVMQKSFHDAGTRTGALVSLPHLSYEFKELASELQVINSKGFVLQDVSPANILVRGTATIRLQTLGAAGTRRRGRK